MVKMLQKPALKINLKNVLIDIKIFESEDQFAKESFDFMMKTCSLYFDTYIIALK